MAALFIGFFFLYLIFVGLLIMGWNKTIAVQSSRGVSHETMVSIVIPVRNEQAGIGFLLEDIRNQSHQNFEAIVVDDDSNDGTGAVVETFARQDPRFLLLQSRGEGKKTALTTGINASRGEIIVTTDGDCRTKVGWLETVVNYFQSPQTKMVFGGVGIEGSTFFSRVQSHEFLSLVGTAAATLSYGFPSMCNGANLAFRKEVFQEVGGYTNNFHIPSGDDEFLMRKIFQRYPKGIQYVSNGKAVVETKPLLTLKEFVYQRIRWAGKWRHHVSWNGLLAIFIFCFQLSVMLLPVGIVTGWVSLELAALLILSKAIGECIFLKRVAAFVEVPWNWGVFFFLQIVYPLYAACIGLISTFSVFEWKGRKIKSVAIRAVEN